MDDLGLPIAYLVLKVGTPVYDRHLERIGIVEHVLADEDVDIFHGLIVHTRPLPRRHLFADADQIAELRERAVLLSVERADLHEPRTNSRRPPKYPARPDDPGGSGGSADRAENSLQARLRRAWDWINERV
ncbi:MAG: PRC-barrel domain-containing protein [Pseudonocardiaceae bacterium]